MKNMVWAEIAVSEIQAQVPPGARVVFVSGNFNVVHPGHVRLLRFAADCGGFIVVGLHPEGTLGATLSEEMRLDGVRAISLVNHAFVMREPAPVFLARLRPDVVVKGKEFEGRHNIEQSIVESYGGKLLFSSGEMRFSSLDLLHREYFEKNLSAIRKPTDYPERHDFSIPDLKGVIEGVRGIRAIVIGDLIVDEYISCDPLGMSQEDPTIVVTPIEQKRFVGGAGIVAAHARGLGAEVRYFSVSGTDEAARFARETLDSYGVRHEVFADDSRPTTLKQRFRARGKTLLRVSHLRQHDVSPAVANQIMDEVRYHIARTDILIFSDFNYGCLPQTLVDQLIQLCKLHGVKMVADSQASSQLGDISRFTGMALVTPTEREARLALQDPNSGLVVLAEALRKKARAENIVITLGSEGVIIHSKNGNSWIDDRLPAFNTQPKDVAGAGDSLLACTALCLCAGADIWQSVYLGSLAAACQVSQLGNLPLAQDDIFSEIQDS